MVSLMVSDKEFFMKNHRVGKGLPVLAACSAESEVLPSVPPTELRSC